MFFKQIRRNAARNRKGNGLFFGSLVIAIVAFYTLLSIGEQDVMQFLSTVESDAVGKLLGMLPIVYAVSLFFVFFLVYFACRYQIDDRRQELGMYLMLGMKQSSLFVMLFGETLWSSLISLLTGLPAALFLTEGISLATARIVGLGILGHRFSISLSAVLWTVCGFVLVQLLSMLIICVSLSRTEPADFFRSGDAKRQTVSSGTGSTIFFGLGLVFLLSAYYLGIFRLQTLSPAVMLAAVVFGISGTFLLYRGLGGFLGRRIPGLKGARKHFGTCHDRNGVPECSVTGHDGKGIAEHSNTSHDRKRAPEGLRVFTARQVQENVLSQHRPLAVSSLLLMTALACISFGISMGLGRSVSSRSVDFSLLGEEAQIDFWLAQEDIREMIQDSYPLYLSHVKSDYYENPEQAFDISELKAALSGIEAGGRISQNLYGIEYVIAESSYNHILEDLGKEPLDLSNGHIALYSSLANDGDFGAILQEALQKHVSVSINDADYELLPALCYDNVVADQAITLYLGWIVPDDLYTQLAREPEEYCRNVRLRDDLVEELGLMQAVQKMDALLADTGIEYDSYLKGIGRNLFYTVAASYLTIYLGVLFWLIANTVIGLKYLIAQRRTRHRYEILTMLGADLPSMQRSVRKQIGLYFSLVLATALASSVAAIAAMFTSFARLPVGVPMEKIAAIAGVALAVFALLETLYIRIVKRMACREIGQLEAARRQ